MSKYVQADTDYNYKINFDVDGELVVPSAATITLTDAAGAVVDSIEDDTIALVANATSAVFTIPDTANDLTEDFTVRYITVKFTYNSKEYIIDDYYVIKESLRLPVSKQDVRNLIGFSSSELSDDQIDLFIAFSDLQTEVEQDIEDLIADGSTLIPYIQMALKSRAVLNSLGMIELSVMQSEQADNTLYKRFQTVDFKEALKRVQDMYNRAVLAINGTSADAVSITTIVIGTPTDPITGQ